MSNLDFSTKGDLDKYFPSWQGGWCSIPDLLSASLIFDGGGDMREILLAEWFYFARIWQLTTLKTGPLGENRNNVFHCYQLLRDFGDDDNNKNEMPDLAEHCKEFAEIISRLFSKDPIRGSSITESDLTQYKRWFRDLTTLLLSETGKLTVILLEEKMGYSVNTLWKHQKRLLLVDVYQHLSDFVKDNFKEAAKCFVLNCHTAVGFHSMRCVEQVARKYYMLIMGKPPKCQYTKGGERELGLGEIGQQLINQYVDLQKQKTESGELGIIGPTLRALNRIYRTPIMHPKIKTLTPNQAVNNFEQMKGVISMIVLDVIKGGPHIKSPWAGDPF